MIPEIIGITIILSAGLMTVSKYLLWRPMLGLLGAMFLTGGGESINPAINAINSNELVRRLSATLQPLSEQISQFSQSTHAYDPITNAIHALARNPGQYIISSVFSWFMISSYYAYRTRYMSRMALNRTRSIAFREMMSRIIGRLL